MVEPEKLEPEIKRFIVETLDLDDVLPENLDSEMALFGEGLGLDSVDALELGIALKKRYGIVVDPKAEDTRSHFQCVRTLARLVARSQAAPA
jgi:acyl carrier protein